MEATYKALMNIYTKDRFDLIFAIKNGEKTVADFDEDVRAFCRENYSMEENIDDLVERLKANLFGYSVLEPLLKDDDVTDIKVHFWDRIIVKRKSLKGTTEVSDIKFDSEEAYDRFIDSVKTRNGINASNVKAISKFADYDTNPDYVIRFTLIIGILTTYRNNELIIRKFPKHAYTWDRLIKDEMMTPEVADYLKKTWSRGSVLICGAPSGGKSTLLNTLKEEIPHNKSVIVMQESDELTTDNHPDMIFLHSLDGGVESDVRYGLKELTIASLTMDIQYCLIGEIKSGEARYLLNASYTGLTCGATIHANSASDALDKVVDYALYNSDYSKKELLAMLSSFKTIVFMKQYKVAEIDEVKGFDGNEIKYEPVYRDYAV